MGTSALKSTPITNLDASPPVANTSGEGGPGRLTHVQGYVTAVAADAAGSTYRLCRIPSNCEVKSVVFESEAQGAGKVQLGLYYSTSTTDGTPAASVGTAINTKFFSDDIDCASAVARSGAYTYGSGGAYTLDKRNQPIWQAAGLTSDPGGFFDIVATVHTTAITTGTGKLGAECEFVW